ncbi:MAG: hypothetical protein ACYC7D_06405 [Nitrososphaerales archaeon]
MRYTCKKCKRPFDSKEDADAHENLTGHSVELTISSTYWGAHLATVVR